MLLITLLSLLLILGTVTLLVMIHKTRGEDVQPPDVIPYVETPGDLADQIMESRWED
jgi:hypothetical protein